jgi:hypothetical protein
MLAFKTQRSPPRLCDYTQTRDHKTIRPHLISYLLINYVTEPNLLSKWVGARHKITQLLSCVLWDHISSEYNPPLILGFPIIYGEHWGCVLWSFQQTTVNYQSYSIASYYFGKGPSFSLLMLWPLELKNNPIGYNSSIIFRLDESNHTSQGCFALLHTLTSRIMWSQRT